MDISNKTLAMFLVAAIVASIAGTMISLDKLGAIDGPTGYVPHDYTGNVTINISEELSITISTDSTIDFGACAPLAGQTAFLSSTNNTDAWDSCGDSGSLPDEFVILNDGNVHANVTVNVTNTGTAHSSGTFIPNSAGGGDSYIAYAVTDDDAGCLGGDRPAAGFHNFTDTTSSFQLCDNLTFTTATKDVNVDIGIGLPADATPGAGAQNVSIIFWGQES